MVEQNNVPKSAVGIVVQRFVNDGATRVAVTKVGDDNYTVRAE